MDYAHRSRGLLFTLAGVLLLTPDALMIRLSDMTELDLLFWRAALAAPVFLMALAIVSLRNRGFAWLRFNRSFLLLTLCFTGTGVLFGVSIAMTKVANVLVLIALAPIFTAFIDWIFLKEKLARRTWVAIVTSFFGVVILVGGGIGSGSITGDVLALFSALLLGLQFSLMGRCPSETALPAIAIGYSLPAFLLAPFISSFSLSVASANIPATLFMGLLIMPFSFILIRTGTRYLPPPQAALFLLVETACGPLLVWLVLGEHPGTFALIGGGIILATLIVQAIVELAIDRRLSKGPLTPAPLDQQIMDGQLVKQ